MKPVGFIPLIKWSFVANYAIKRINVKHGYNLMDFQTFESIVMIVVQRDMVKIASNRCITLQRC